MKLPETVLYQAAHEAEFRLNAVSLEYGASFGMHEHVGTKRGMETTVL